MKKKKFSAFTLAEVLIALTIIGVAAALTVPALIQRTQKQEYVSALQKVYSTLSQATNMIIAENGSPKGDEGWADSSDHVYQLYKKYLNNVKECGSEAGCSHRLKLKSGAADPTNWETYTDAKKLILSDGVQLAFYYADAGKCDKNEDGTLNICAKIGVDLNGEKGPNQWGRDYFRFVIKEDGLYPMGCDSEACVNSVYGGGCACKVLREGAMNY